MRQLLYADTSLTKDIVLWRGGNFPRTTHPARPILSIKMPQKKRGLKHSCAPDPDVSADRWKHFKEGEHLDPMAYCAACDAEAGFDHAKHSTKCKKYCQKCDGNKKRKHNPLCYAEGRAGWCSNAMLLWFVVVHACLLTLVCFGSRTNRSSQT
jgi:hypothetical protein